MTRKLILVSIVLVGFVLALGSNAWADRGRHGNRHYHGKSYHQSHKAHHGHHYGWAKGKRHHHRHGYRHHRAYRHRDHYRRPVVVEKHVYHDYQTEESIEENDGFKFAFSVADDVFEISVAVSDTD